MVDRRAHFRYSLMTAVAVETPRGSATASTCDLSTTGALIRCNDRLRKGEALKLEVVAPGYGIPMMVDAVVIRDAGRIARTDTLFPHLAAIEFSRPLDPAALRA